jgi:hypothetical protein
VREIRPIILIMALRAVRLLRLEVAMRVIRSMSNHSLRDRPTDALVVIMPARRHSAQHLGQRVASTTSESRCSSLSASRTVDMPRRRQSGSAGRGIDRPAGDTRSRELQPTSWTRARSSAPGIEEVLHVHCAGCSGIIHSSRSVAPAGRRHRRTGGAKSITSSAGHAERL